MPRTPQDVAHTDKIAVEIDYIAPPAHLDPTGRLGEDPTWSDLVDWFRGQEIAWAPAVQVYISRRWGVPIEEVYADIDSWKKHEIDRIDREDDPDAVISFN